MVSPTDTPNANPQIGQITFLKRKPDSQRAHGLLQDLTHTVSYLMLKNKLKVGTLAEFYPRDKRLLGLNVNHGMKIMVRLRSPYNDAEFLSWESIMETMIHELTHNRFGPHDAKFNKQMEEFRVDQWYYERMGMHNTFLGTGRKVGGGDSKRQAVRRGGFVGKGKKLGSSSDSSERVAPGQRLSPREMAALAAAKRYVNDEAEMCHDDTVNIDEVLENHNEMESQMEIVVIPDEDTAEISESGSNKDDARVLLKGDNNSETHLVIPLDENDCPDPVVIPLDDGDFEESATPHSNNSHENDNEVIDLT